MEILINEMLALVGRLTGCFVAKDAHNFPVLNFMMALGVLTLLVAFMAYRRALWVQFKYIWRHRIKKHS